MMSRTNELEQAFINAGNDGDECVRALKPLAEHNVTARLLLAEARRMVREADDALIALRKASVEVTR